MKKYAKIIALIVGIIYSISQIYDVFMTYKSNFKKIVDGILEFDFLLIGQILLLIGVILVVTAIVVFSIKRIFNLNKPKRDALDYFAEMLLPEDQLENSEPKHQKRLRKFTIINIGLYILVFGICLTIGIKIFNKVFNNSDTNNLTLNEHLDCCLSPTERKTNNNAQVNDFLTMRTLSFTFENSETTAQSLYI